MKRIVFLLATLLAPPPAFAASATSAATATPTLPAVAPAAEPEPPALPYPRAERLREFISAFQDAAATQFDESQRRAAADISQRLFLSESLPVDAPAQVARWLRSLPWFHEFDLLGDDLAAREAQWIAAPPVRGTVILSLRCTGDPDIHFTQIQPRGRHYHDRDTLSADIPTSGVTLALLDTTTLPPGRHRLYVVLRDMDTGAILHTITLSVDKPDSPRLRVRIRDEDGESTPALARLTHLRTGAVWPPAGTVDLYDQTHGQLKLHPGLLDPLGGLPLTTPGPWRGWCWAAPGEFEQPLPAGEWELRALHGLEYEPIHTTFTLLADAAASPPLALDIDLRRWIDMPARGWWSGDDQVHARMWTRADAERLLDFAEAADAHVVHVLSMGDSMRTWFAQRGYGPDARVARGAHVLIPGQEDPRFVMGHAIGLNIAAPARDVERYALYDAVAEEVRAGGGLYGFTHAGQAGNAIERDMALQLPFGRATFVSIMQVELGTALYYDALDLGYRLTASAGTDMTFGGAMGSVRVYAHGGPGAKPDPDAWMAAFAAGRTFVTDGPMLELTVDGVGPGETIDVETSRTLTARARAWGWPGLSAPRTLSIVSLSTVTGQVVADDPATRELELTAEMPAGHGCWIAARVDGEHGTVAHTTPVWVERRGFRAWNRRRATEVIARQLEILDAIEADATEAERQWNQPNPWPGNDPLRRHAENAPALRERIERAREEYRKLSALLETERETIAGKNDDAP